MSEKFYALPGYEDDAPEGVGEMDPALEDEVKSAVLGALDGVKLAERTLVQRVVHEVNHAVKAVGERRVTGPAVKRVIASMLAAEEIKQGARFLPAEPKELPK